MSAFNSLLYGWDPGAEIGKSLFLVLDLNHWLGNVNADMFAMMAEKHNLKGVIVKVSDAERDTGKPFIDSRADQFYRMARDLSLGVGGYHWLQASIDPKVAWNYYYSWVKDHPLQIPYILDFEEKQMPSATDMLWRAQTWFDLANAVWNGRTMCYTGLGYMQKIKDALIREGKDWVSKIEWMGKQPLWLAMYSRYWPEVLVRRSMRWYIYQDQPLFPWKTWAGWQYSDKADKKHWFDEDGLDAREWGFDSRNLDMNLFRADWFDENVKTDNQPEPEEPEQPPSITTYAIEQFTHIEQAAKEAAQTLQRGKENEHE